MPKRPTFRIGAVARMTGISPDALRIWERRYSVVEPVRTDTGNRLYTTEHVERLRLLKDLVDRGHAIGTIANLSDALLHERLEQALPGTHSQMDRGLAHPAQGPLRTVLAGKTLSRMFDNGTDYHAEISIAATYEDLNSMMLGLMSMKGKTPALALEVPYIDDSIVDMSKTLVEEGHFRFVLLIYNFCNYETLQKVNHQSVFSLRAPYTLRALWDKLLQLRDDVEQGHEVPDADLRQVGESPRIFSEAQLVNLAGQSRSVRCECPKHLVDLIQNLVAFEEYSRFCENRNKEDEALHHMLLEQTGRAREIIEQALMELVRLEGLSINRSKI